MTTQAFVYIWFDKRDYRFYLGYTNGKKKFYICSSKYMLKEYKERPNDFKRRILKKGTEKEMALLEKELLDKRKHLFGSRYYNEVANFPLGMIEWHKRNPGYFAGKKNPNYGNNWSDEIKQKIGAANKGKKRTKEQKLQMSLQRKEEFVSGKRVQWNKGKTLTEEHKKKCSESNKGIFNPFKGRQHTEETKKRISEANKGKSPPNKGQKMSAEQRKKLSIAKKAYFKKNPGAMKGKNHPSYGRKISKEQQQKMYLGRIKAAKEKWGGYNTWKKRKDGTLPI